MKQGIIGLIFLVALALSSCMNSPRQTTPGPSGGGLGIKQDVEISGFVFNPSTVTVPVGATVIWTNRDSASHTVVSDSGNEIASNSLATGDTYGHTFSTPGTYAYHCSVHPSMKGTIIVQ
jgi:plastocyanin